MHSLQCFFKMPGDAMDWVGSLLHLILSQYFPYDYTEVISRIAFESIFEEHSGLADNHLPLERIFEDSTELYFADIPWWTPVSFFDYQPNMLVNYSTAGARVARYPGCACHLLCSLALLHQSSVQWIYSTGFLICICSTLVWIVCLFHGFRAANWTICPGVTFGYNLGSRAS